MGPAKRPAIKVSSFGDSDFSKLDTDYCQCLDSRPQFLWIPSNSLRYREILRPMPPALDFFKTYIGPWSCDRDVHSCKVLQSIQRDLLGGGGHKVV
jgi:hypothetical protein